MTGEVTKRSQEVDNIGREADTDTYQQMIKFKKGDYWCGEDEIELGTRYIAHCIGWTKSWVHFENRAMVERRNYRVAKGERAPERDQIPNNDPATWPMGLDGKNRADPWVLQYLLPLENPETGEVHIFVGSSFGSRRAVGTLCSAYARHAAKGDTAQPIIELQATSFPTKNYGDVDAPLFTIVAWDSGESADVQPELKLDDSKSANDLDDEIPF